MAPELRGDVFIANRGEIAVRIARAVQSLGLRACGVYTPSDACSPHRWAMDMCDALPGPQSYLDAQHLIAVAKRHQARFVHPGYGFLSQDPSFATAVQQAGLTFVGPSDDAMRALGDKGAARERAEALHIPTIVGASHLRSDENIRQAIERIGYPVLLKAPNAGGGRGLIPVHSSTALSDSVERVRRVAGENTPLVVERWLGDARHVEVQVVADGKFAKAVGTRDCSTQRRQQKLIEEAPASRVPNEVATQMQRDAEALFVDAKFRGVGTVEFLIESNGAYSFLEVNPRLQVEHTVTEEIFGIDLVAWQLRLASGESIPRETLAPRGHAIEARLVAEDPATRFAPQTGHVCFAEWPSGPGIRVDAGVATGSEVSPHYDSLLAKVIAWAPTREQAIGRLVLALRETTVLGVMTNKAHLLTLLRSERFVQDRLHTRWLDDVPFASPSPPVALIDDTRQSDVQWLTPSASASAGHNEARAAALPSSFSIDDDFGRTCSAS